MPKFIVEFIRTTREVTDIKLSAKDQDEAENLAADLAAKDQCDWEFIECEYETNEINEEDEEDEGEKDA